MNEFNNESCLNVVCIHSQKQGTESLSTVSTWLLGGGEATNDLNANLKSHTSFARGVSHR